MGIDGKYRPLPDLDLAYIGLVDARMDLHLPEIARDREKDRSREARGECLTLIDGAAENDSIDR